jgi:hypothetical protein
VKYAEPMVSMTVEDWRLKRISSEMSGFVVDSAAGVCGSGGTREARMIWFCAL